MAGWRRRLRAVLFAAAMLVATALASGAVTVALPAGVHPIRFGLAGGADGATAVRTATAGGNWVTAENARPGSSGWRIRNPGTDHAVEGFADHSSATAGDEVTLYVSTVAPSFHVEAWRMGWYGGQRGRLVWRSRQVRGGVQPGPARDPRTNLLEAHWRPSLALDVGDAWVPGCYLLKLVAPGVGERYVPLTVRDDASNAALVLMNAVTTWQAYNAWGGRNLYWGPGGSWDADRRSRVVSFDRPYRDGWGASDFLGNELPLVGLVEEQGMDVTYLTDVDLHERPQLLLGHRALVSLGHDEYWSTAMRTAVEQARDHGVNLAFLGANAMFRHIRLEPSPLGPDRHEVNYKSWSAHADPAWRTDKQEVTTEWREPPLDRPESAVLGEQYECNPVRAGAVVVDPRSWLLQGTGLRQGQVLPDLVGPEYDRVMPGTPTPPTVRLVFHSPLKCRGHRTYADITYYTAASGAGVLDTGTSTWVCQLAGACATGRSNPLAAAAVRRITLNTLTAFAAGPAALAHPAVSNLAGFRLRPSGL